MDAGIADKGPQLDANGWRMLPLMTWAVEWEADIYAIGPRMEDPRFSVSAEVKGWVLKIQGLAITSG